MGRISGGRNGVGQGRSWGVNANGGGGNSEGLWIKGEKASPEDQLYKKKLK